jgi:hypothetical protein
MTSKDVFGTIYPEISITYSCNIVLKLLITDRYKVIGSDYEGGDKHKGARWRLLFVKKVGLTEDIAWKERDRLHQKKG